ncbi:MAG: fold metallo-hydrolase [Herminiimonas sp.]|nr:fold metallo-hydrolase [Herminiimonas sp.]MDB5853594.1 fold metallo-hydrolase [Herminiimonas sp.]
MTQVQLVPRPAATVVLLRDTPKGMEVFMVQRTHKAAFIPGGFVFPGGALDASDHDPIFATQVAGVDDESASRALGLASGGLAYWVAAIRECFEESGLLLAHDARQPASDGRLVTGSAREFEPLRQQLASGAMSWPQFCRDRQLKLALEQLAYLSHWITPAGSVRRFDTRFFMAHAPDQQDAAHDNTETIAHAWVRPADMLERHRSGEATIMFATKTTLELLAKFSSAEAAISHVRGLKDIQPITPRVTTSSAGRKVIAPGHPAWAEVGRLDPDARGTVSSELVPGVPTRLAPKVLRIAAPNPGFMTGAGTNSYLLGDADALAVIDPGPAIDEHIERLLEAGAGKIRWILTTHTHKDHSPAAALLREKTGAEVLGMPAPRFDNQDVAFQPDRVPLDGEVLRIAGVSLRVIHTPGHASNHLCYLLEDEKMLFTGDHIMQGSTVVINPPDGDMAVYLESLRALKSLDVEVLAPGHGFLMEQPHQVVDRLLAHRAKREAKVKEALVKADARSLEQLVQTVYDDVPVQRHAMARRSLLAHLLKLKAEGHAVQSGDLWRAA